MPASRPAKVRLIVISIALAATLPLSYCAFWWVAAARFQSAAMGWIEARKAEGYAVAYSAVRRDGFPTRLRLRFHDPMIASPSAAAPWSWSGSRVVAEIVPWSPLHITLRAGGDQRVKVPEPNGTRVYAGTAASVSASVTPDRSLPVRTVAIRDLMLNDRESGDVVAAKRLDIALHRNPGAAGSGKDGGYDLSILASDLTLPSRLRLPLGERVGRLMLDADVMGDPRANAWPGGLFEWRDAGGVVEVKALDVHYGPLRLSGVGTLTLDDAGQPMGAFNIRAEGLAETLGVLDRRGFFKGFGVASAKLALRVLSVPSETGVPGVSGPLTLRDRILSAASLPLLKLPAIRWRPRTLDGPR